MKQTMKFHVTGIESGVIKDDQTHWAKAHCLMPLEGEGKAGRKGEALRCDYEVAQTLSASPLPGDFDLEFILESRKLANGGAGFGLRICGFAAPVKKAA